MSLSGIISVSGLPGLHKILSHTKNGLIVESLEDEKRRPIYASQKVSALEDISIYTTKDDVPLSDVFKLIFDKEKGKATLDHKKPADELRAYLTAILKDLDNDKVYNSDIAKVFQWYNILVVKDLLKEDKKEKKKEKEKEEEAKVSTDTKKKTAKKTAQTSKADVKKAVPKRPQAKTQTGARKASGRKS
jgi:hypothetical protein